MVNMLMKLSMLQGAQGFALAGNSLTPSGGASIRLRTTAGASILNFLSAECTHHEKDHALAIFIHLLFTDIAC